MNALRRWAATSPLRNVLLHPRVRHLLASILALRFLPAAWAVDRPFAFLWADVRKVGIRSYRLRATGEPIVIRHGCNGLELLDEIFRRRCYDPPRPVAALIGAAPRVLDVGANVGGYSAFVRGRWPDARIVAIEADADNVEALRLFADLDASGTVEVLEAAATTNDAPLQFGSGRGSGSRIVAAGGDLVAGVDLLAMLPTADLVKMDIEGGEWPILSDERLAMGGPLVLVMEYHRRSQRDTTAGDAATELLENAGFEVGFVESNYWGHGTLWAWRT